MSLGRRLELNRITSSCLTTDAKNRQNSASAKSIGRKFNVQAEPRHGASTKFARPVRLGSADLQTSPDCGDELVLLGDSLAIRDVELFGDEAKFINAHAVQLGGIDR